MVLFGSLSGKCDSVQMTTTFIDEPGLYSLILQSKKSIAKQI
jgi:prophage antirepressor-like protein